ncbi:MAG TPA: glycosyltransferase [Thermoanaerobaculia bacterium]|nr:glycosyltransferase [Thermoanaerobaculia bacterium]
MITIAIPTYNRGAILVETIARLLELQPRADAIVIADQTREHPRDVHDALERWSRDGTIQWLRLDEPSIPHAMNEALVVASTSLVLFLDDDLIPDKNLAAAHIDAHSDPTIWAVAGQVLQPGEEPMAVTRLPGLPAAPSGGRRHSPGNRATGQPGNLADLDFPFHSTQARAITNVMAGNLSVKRERALQIGGFDENFTGAAYRFETDFAMRIAAAGGRIWFEPRASIRHLKLSTGGLRSFGDHRSVASPVHTMGDYYFALHHVPHFWRYAAQRVRRNVLTRYHATHPWTIPAKLLAEWRGVVLARELYRKGRKLRSVR